LTVGGIALLVVVVVAWGAGAFASGPATAPTGDAALVPALEAGVATWQLPVALSRAAVVPSAAGVTVLGGLDATGTSTTSVTTITPSGVVRTGAPLAVAVHDASAATLGGATYVFGGGSPATVATVQAVPAAGPTAAGASLPAPRSDSAAVTIGSTAFVVGGYTGTDYLPAVLATTDGRTFRTVASLPVPVRYPAVAADGPTLYVLGGEVHAASGTAATSAVQAVDTATGAASVVAHLPQPLYGAAAFDLGGVLYVVGGESPGGRTLTTVDAYVPASHRVLFAGLLPQADAFGGAATVGTGAAALGYLVGGAVTAQGGADAAGVPSGTLRTVLVLRPSRTLPPAGRPDAGSPFTGHLLVADRGNDRLLVLTPQRAVAWSYPAPGRPAPAGGFYFPDDAFFFDRGRAIISNQEDNDTIVEIGYPSGRVLWSYGHPRAPGSAPGYLSQPDDAYYLRSGNVLVADAGNNEVKVLSRSGALVDRIGNGADRHVPGVSIAYPNGDTPLANGDVLVSEVNVSRIDEYTLHGRLVWSVHVPGVVYPSDPQPLGGGRFLMTDYNPSAEGRLVEFTRNGRVVWRYDAPAGDAMLDRPSLAERLPNGLVMVNDDYRDRVVVIDPATNEIVWQYGLTDLPGTAAGRLSIPDGFDLLGPGGTSPTHPQTG
jgi:hypothetical protein